LDYCQYLLVSQINYTLTNYADHSEKFSHDMVNRYLAEEVIRPRLVWENAQAQVEPSQYGFLALTIQSWTRTTPTRLNRLQFSSLARP